MFGFDYGDTLRIRWRTDAGQVGSDTTPNVAEVMETLSRAGTWTTRCLLLSHVTVGCAVTGADAARNVKHLSPDSKARVQSFVQAKVVVAKEALREFVEGYKEGKVEEEERQRREEEVAGEGVGAGGQPGRAQEQAQPSNARAGTYTVHSNHCGLWSLGTMGFHRLAWRDSPPQQRQRRRFPPTSYSFEKLFAQMPLFFEPPAKPPKSSERFVIGSTVGTCLPRWMQVTVLRFPSWTKVRIFSRATASTAAFGGHLTV